MKLTTPTSVFVNRRAHGAMAKAFVLFSVGVLFYILNYYTPLYADDYSYSFSFATRERISSLEDIVRSQIAHYDSMNGRFATHSLAQLFLWIGKDAFNYLNVGVFLLLGILICYHGKGSLCDIAASDLAIAFGILFLSAPAFGQSFLWVDGSATYSTGIVIALLYLIPYRRLIYQIQKGQYEPGVWGTRVVRFIYMLALGVIAGNTSENVGAVLILLTMLCTVYFLCHKVRFSLWMLGLGNLLGTVLSIISPGTQGRMEVEGGLSVAGMLKSVVFIGADFLEHLQLPLCIFAGQVFAYWMSGRFSASKKGIEEISVVLIYFTGLLASAFSMILSPKFPDRAWSIVVTLLAIVIILCFDVLKKHVSQSRILSIATAACLTVMSLGVYINVYFDLKNVYTLYQSRVACIETAVRNGENTVEISTITSDSPYSVFESVGDLSWDSSEWPNTAIARYYGMDEIVRVQEKRGS